MNVFLYIIFFIMGITFGSFYTLAVHRIPQCQDITHTHSYCPNCNHKLNILDLIPVLSYIFLGGKCRYCNKNIRPRYFILEIMSGLAFIIVAFLMGLNAENLTILKIINYLFFTLFFTFIVLLVGIYKENKIINKTILIYGIIIFIMYIVYLYIIEKLVYIDMLYI